MNERTDLLLARLEQLLSEVHMYVGARYVPNFIDDPHDPDNEYQALDVVDNGSGTSYIAKKPVPVGVALSDREYWFVYGSTSGAIINLQNQIDAIVADLQTLTDKIYYVTPEQYGAVGDEVADDTTAIQRAINSGHPVYFSKKYLVTSSITLTQYTYLFGDGGEIKYTGSGYLFECPLGGEKKPIIEHLRFIGTNSNKFINVKQTSGWGSSISLRDLFISNFDAGIMNFYDAYLFEVINCRIWSTGEITLDGNEFSSAGTFKNCMFISHDNTSHNYVINLIKALNILIDNCTFEYFNEAIHSSSTYDVGDITVNSCWFENGTTLSNNPQIWIISPHTANVTKATTSTSYNSITRYFGRVPREYSVSIETTQTDAYKGLMRGENIPINSFGMTVNANGTPAYLALYDRFTKKEVSHFPRNVIQNSSDNVRTQSLNLITDMTGFTNLPIVYDVLINANFGTDDNLMCRASIIRTQAGKYIIGNIEKLLYAGNWASQATPTLSISNNTLTFDASRQAVTIFMIARYENVGDAHVEY